MSEYNRFRAMTKSYFLNPLFDYFLKTNDFFLIFFALKSGDMIRNLKNCLGPGFVYKYCGQVLQCFCNNINA